ncbi:uncharacterized protein TNCV_5095941 [Trichonephila clavipes]|nr:uncharacterized protein TNCV_5095941 [Trichonephila clavipes]
MKRNRALLQSSILSLHRVYVQRFRYWFYDSVLINFCLGFPFSPANAFMPLRRLHSHRLTKPIWKQPKKPKGLVKEKTRKTSQNDDEIVTSVQESDPVDDKTDEDEDYNESSKDPSNAHAFSALETALEWYEQQSECCPIQLLLLKRIRDLAAKKRRCTMVQRKISGYFPH